MVEAISTETVSKELKTLGQALQQKRKERNLSLKEVENGTSIRMVHLQAIEEGTIFQALSMVYAQGFIKQYANFLGEDGEAFLRAHPNLLQKKGDSDFAYGLGTLETLRNPSHSIKWLPGATWAFLFAFVLVLAWYVAHWFEVL